MMQPNKQEFPQTRWSLVKIVQQGDEKASRQAMEIICQRYWYPIYAYLRHSGNSPADAEDLTQGFFHHLISTSVILSADQSTGRLRSYLLGVLKHHLSDQHRRASAQKRGGGKSPVPIDEALAAELYQLTPHDTTDLDKLFDRAWAIGVLTVAENKLRAAFAEGNNEPAFEHLREYLPLGDSDTPYGEVAAAMGLREPVVRLQIHRMRKRYRTLIESEIAQTVDRHSDIESELGHLMAALGR